MKKQATKRIVTFTFSIIILSFFHSLGSADGIGKTNLVIASDPSVHNEYHSQDNLQHLYGLYDEGLMDSKQIYQIGKLVDSYDSDSKESYTMEYDLIDFEMYTKNQEYFDTH